MKTVKVFQHGVGIGVIPLNEYNELRQAVSEDKRLSFLQCIIGLIAFCRFLFSVAKTAFVFIIAMLMLFFLFDYQTLVSGLSSVESIKIATSILKVYEWFFLVAFVLHTMLFVFDSGKFFKSLGYYSVKDEKLSERLRVLLDSPASGPVYVKIIDEQ